MADLVFRDLRADEIDCRIGTVKEAGLSLLLYKDARCDMAILDETVGAYNWQRSHSRDNANCTVSIWDEDKKQWISKEDVGTESNTEAVKGLASDSFKRACFNWGIGRELYTAPFIWVDKSKFESKYDKFSVETIKIEEKKITALSIRNEETGEIVFSYPRGKRSSSTKTKSTESPKVENKEKPKAKVQFSPAMVKLSNYCNENGFTQEEKRKIIIDCKLKPDSPDDLVEVAMKYASDMKEQKDREKRPDDYGEVPFPI